MATKFLRLARRRRVAIAALRNIRVSGRAAARGAPSAAAPDEATDEPLVPAGIGHVGLLQDTRGWIVFGVAALVALTLFVFVARACSTSLPATAYGSASASAVAPPLPPPPPLASDPGTATGEPVAASGSPVETARPPDPVPEPPDLEYIVRNLRPRVAGRTVTEVPAIGVTRSRMVS